MKQSIDRTPCATSTLLAVHKSEGIQDKRDALSVSGRPVFHVASLLLGVRSKQRSCYVEGEMYFEHTCIYIYIGPTLR